MPLDLSDEPVVQPPADERRIRRRKLKVEVALALDGELLGRGRMLDFSDAGARIESDGVAVPDRFQLVDIGAGVAYSARVVWRKGRTLGIAFLSVRDVDAKDTPEWITLLWREMREAA